jgi:mRNA interferase HigB
MRVISKSRLSAFWRLHPQSQKPLAVWFEIAENADWTSLHDVKRAYPSTDYIGNDRYVFNIAGNKYRLIVMIFFEIGRIYIRYIGTHSEYDKINARDI